jgi:hypothetical protein
MLMRPVDRRPGRSRPCSPVHSAGASAEQSEVGISSIDLAGAAQQVAGERARTQSVAASRGMKHSNHARELQRRD